MAVEYHQLEDIENGEASDHLIAPATPNKPPTKPGMLRRTLQAPYKSMLHNLSLAIVLLLAFGGLVTLIQHLTALFATHQPLSCNCGTSLHDALAMNCQYDTLASAWLPPHCRDDELTALFDRAGPGPNGAWAYYADQNGTQPLTVDEVARLPLGTNRWSTFEWHVAHCFFVWRKQYRARFRPNIVEGKYDNEFHITHCAKEFLRRNPLQMITTFAGTDLQADHSSYEARFTEAQRRMFAVDHVLREEGGGVGRG
ncbi:hypothetical protein MMC13_006925 [Lambiella insularis]|nr:hypothetical protein [Lambiella insularis]